MIRPPDRTFEIPRGDGFPVIADFYRPATAAYGAIVIICHGFKGHRRWAFIPHVAASLSEAGVGALAIDMSLNGADAAAGLYVYPERFERNTLAREVDDLRATIRFVAEGSLDIPGADTRFGFLGHSRGAVPCTIAAIEYPGARALCTWSAPPDPDTFTHAQKARWRREGVYAFTNANGTTLGVGIDYLDDLERNHATYHLAERVKELRVPHLIVHGESDMVVPAAGARTLHAAERHSPDSRLVMIRTGHTFGIPYPAPATLDRVPAALEAATEATVSWFVEHLTGE